MNGPSDVVLELLKRRRSTRRFSPEGVSPEEIARLTEAGQCAPFAVIGTFGKEPVRTFFVLERDSASRIAVRDAFAKRTRRMAKLGSSRWGPHLFRMLDFLQTRRALPLSVYRQMGALMRQASTETGHFKELSTAPYWIIVAERRRAPGMARALIRQSLAHSMQNMWIMATAMELGFQLVSLSSMLADDREVCRALGVAAGDYEFDACLVGRPVAPTIGSTCGARVEALSAELGVQDRG